MRDLRVPRSAPAPNTSSAAALTATLALAAGCWVIAVRQMSGMDLGAATRLGSLGFFLAAWVPMMAAMMLPGAGATVVRLSRSTGGARAVPRFVAVYLALWTVFGLAGYLLYRPHGALAAGVVVIGTGLYELTPIKARCRARCRRTLRPGEFALGCVGSSIGLMIALLALGVMSVAWMAIIAVLVLTQKILPARRAVDVPLALALVGLGIVIVVAPASIPGLVPAAHLPAM